MIDGVKIKKLIIHKDYRGKVMEMLRNDDSLFAKFGQVYMTTVLPGVVKGWHYHKTKIDHFTCVHGKIRLGLYDYRKDSPTYGKTQEFILSLDNPLLVKIPPFVLHGFECIGKQEAVVVNVSSVPYNPQKPDENRIDPFNNNIPFKWKSKKGG